MYVWSRVVAMLSRATSPLLTVAVLAALRVSASPGPGCDNGKLYVERDLPEADLHWDCPESTWPAQNHLSIDTLYDPEPPSQVCMDQPISYDRSIPSSGAHRPIRAESGEYLYCPPQRWINNLHNSATVLLYHPCAPLRERRLLSVLARSCLSDYIITPHPQLSKHTLIALVSWAHTLELSTVATPGACDWLEATTRTRVAFGGARPSTTYDHLLTRSAKRRWRPGEWSANTKGSVRRCCEGIISQFSTKAEAKSRSIREIPTSRAGQETHTPSRVRGPSAGSPPGNGTAPPQTHIQNIGRGLQPVLGSKTLRAQSLGGAQRSGLRKPHPPLMSHDVNNSSREQAAGSIRKEDAPRGQMKSHEIVDLKERELDLGSQRNPDPTTHPPNSAACGGCSAGRVCRCSEDPDPRPAEVDRGFPRTPRSDEAVWAAAALGFLLVLLTLSVLHTRLYRHWRTPPSLYWHDPQLDYDSVAEVIRRRLRIAKRRRKRGRKQECVLLPSSSSSDELP